MKKVLVFLFIGSAALLLAGWGASFFLKPVTVRLLERATGCDISLSALSFQPPATLIFSKPRLSGGEKEYFEAEEVRLVFRPRTFFSGTLEVEEASVSDPVLRLTRHPDGTVDLVQFLKKRPPSLETPSLPKREILIRSLVMRGGKLLLWDEAVTKRPYPVQLSKVSFSAGGVSFPLADRQIPVVFETWLRGGVFPPAGTLSVKGWVNPKRGACQLSLELQEVELLHWMPYAAGAIPLLIEEGRMDLDAGLDIQEEMLRGLGLFRLRGLILKRTPATTLFEALFGTSQDALITFIEESGGELIFPVTLSGRLGDPRFEIGKDFAKNIRQNVAHALRKGVRKMLLGGSDLRELRQQAKQAVKELEKALRLDRFLVIPRPEGRSIPSPSPQKGSPEVPGNSP